MTDYSLCAIAVAVARRICRLLLPVCTTMLHSDKVFELDSLITQAYRGS